MLTIYPRTILVKRANAHDGVGAQPYQGVLATDEALVVSGLPASIQFTRRSGQPDPGLPADTVSASGYNIFLPLAYSVLGQIKENDIVVDDLGDRYQVVSPYWNILGYNLSCTKLKA